MRYRPTGQGGHPVGGPGPARGHGRLARRDQEGLPGRRVQHGSRPGLGHGHRRLSPPARGALFRGGPDDDVGDPPGSGGSSSLGGGGDQPGGGPYPPLPPGGLPPPEPPDDGEPPADDDEPALLATYSSRLDWLDSAAGGFTGEGPGPAQARRVTGAAAWALASRLNLVALTAAEAEGLGQELLARLEGKKTASSAARAAAMASYVERARAVRAAAQTLANQAESLATRMEGN